MYDVTQDYLDKVTAAGRVYSLRIDVGRLSNGSYTDVASYIGGVGVLALKIVRGQTTGGFSLGGTVCASLNGTFANSINIKVKDRLQVYVRFGSGTDVTAWRGLGWFYVDSVKRGMYSQSVVAYDAMLRLEKNYKSKLAYPAKTSDVLAEISSQTGINLSAGLTLINDAAIEDVPLKDKSQDGEQRYYTRREMLGYVGATNAGSGYIDVDFKINLSIPTEVSQGITASSVISQSIDDTDFSIANIVWNKSGVSYSLDDEFTENTVELVNPLGYVSEELILHNLETKLVGLTYSSVKLKKQGTGIYQLGDLVNYTAPDETVYKMLIMGIVYDFSNGFFSETLYSLAKSASQQEYAGSQVTNQKDYISGEDAITYSVLSEYKYLTDKSVRCNNMLYTVETDSTTGLISKIKDGAGNTLEPQIPTDSAITNVALHNAVFWAVAMARGINVVADLLLFSGQNGQWQFGGGLTGFTKRGPESQTHSGVDKGNYSSGIAVLRLSKSYGPTNSLDGRTSAVIAQSNEKIDLTKYNKLRVQAVLYRNTSSLTGAAYFCTGTPSMVQSGVTYDFSSWNKLGDCDIVTQNYGAPGTPVWYEVDISQLSGEQYLNFGVSHGGNIVYTTYLDINQIVLSVQ